jgi:hypothetical protein
MQEFMHRKKFIHCRKTSAQVEYNKEEQRGGS